MYNGKPKKVERFIYKSIWLKNVLSDLYKCKLDNCKI